MENESGTYNFGARLGEGMEKKIIIILFCLPLIASCLFKGAVQARQFKDFIYRKKEVMEK